MNTVYLSLGANLGEREATLMQAVGLLEQRVGELLRCSSFFYSAPWGFQSEHGFCNLCAAFRTGLTPEEILLRTQAIERELGRTHKTTMRAGLAEYHDRCIDIDLLQYFDEQGNEVRRQSATLTLPHPLMHEREFVMVPLREIKNLKTGD